MSIHVMARVWEESRQGGGTLLVLIAIADCANEDGTGACPSLQTLAHKARLSVRQTQMAIQRLEQDGEISITAGAGPPFTNAYTVLDRQEDDDTSPHGPPDELEEGLIIFLEAGPVAAAQP